jgi:SAM-dependent methyltransferase
MSSDGMGLSVVSPFAPPDRELVPGADASRTPDVARRRYAGPCVRLGSRIVRRLRRRHEVAMAYDMAIEIARLLPRGTRALDVGCGNGYVVHHLRSLLGAPAVGADITPAVEAPIRYVPFDGRSLPFDDAWFDAVLFCYVLHHAGDARALLEEARRVLPPGGRVVIYEDLPLTWFDRFLCRRHERAWMSRSGPCTFLREGEWIELFASVGFRVVSSRRLSRLRDPSHPVARALFVLLKDP